MAELLESGFKALTEDEVKAGSLLRKYLTQEILDEYKGVFTAAPVESSLLDCVQSGYAHHSSKCGIYAADPECYDIYTKLFDPVIRDYHAQLENDKDQLQPDTDFGNLDDVENLDPEKKYIQSSRIRLCRNIEGFPYFAKLTEKQFSEIEEKAKKAFEALDGELAGAYFSLKDISNESQQEMVKRHILFQKGNKYLQDAGCYRFWPIGRGIFHNPAETFMVWVNEEDHLRIMSLTKCGDLGEYLIDFIKFYKAFNC